MCLRIFIRKHNVGSLTVVMGQKKGKVNCGEVEKLAQGHTAKNCHSQPLNSDLSNCWAWALNQYVHAPSLATDPLTFIYPFRHTELVFFHFTDGGAEASRTLGLAPVHLPGRWEHRWSHCWLIFPGRGCGKSMCFSIWWTSIQKQTPDKLVLGRVMVWRENGERGAPLPLPDPEEFLSER